MCFPTDELKRAKQKTVHLKTKYMQEIKTQQFDFTSESNQKEFEKWRRAITAIPFPSKNYWIDGLSLDEEDKVEIAITATYQFININDDTWFWLSILFKKDGTASIDYQQNYSIDNIYRLLPVVNRSLERMGLETRNELNVLSEHEFETWQEGYDLLCEIARRRKVPAFKS